MKIGKLKKRATNELVIGHDDLLLSAIFAGNTASAKLLIQEGCGIDQAAWYGPVAALICAIEKGDKLIVKELIKAGCDTNKVGWYKGRTPLIYAIDREEDETKENK